MTLHALPMPTAPARPTCTCGWSTLCAADWAAWDTATAHHLTPDRDRLGHPFRRPRWCCDWCRRWVSGQAHTCPRCGRDEEV